MTKLRINETVGDTFVDIIFEQGFNLFWEQSGRGKTYLFDLLMTYCLCKNISCAHVGYTLANKPDAVLAACKGCTVALLDNADLYLTKDLANKLKETCDIIIVSIKRARTVFGDERRCEILYEAGKITVR
jgi:hypothetical protein